MKKFFLPLFLLFVGLTIAQQKASRFTDGNDDNAPRNPRMDMMNFVPNEVLLKFKDEITVANGSRVKAAEVNTVDQVLQNYGVTSLEKLFPEVQKPQRMRVMKTPQGNELKIPRIDNIYRVIIPQDEQNKLPVNILQIIDELKALPEIEYAEPNYIYSIDQLQPVGPELTAQEVEKMQSNRQKTNGSAVVPNDPFYPQQWYIPAVKADMVWEQTTGDTTQVIAILDTGVDWTHPDLKNKIWRNWGEIPDNGIDDDGNGLVDDYMGWDYINNDNNPMDDNSHGTHVAGIAAAETNNGIGIAGVNWHAKIMPIKVFQSSGRGDAGTITQGIIYAAQKGATVINMSFGSYARSLAMEDALANAYATTLLVAAAGNNGGDIESCPPVTGPHFPAALSYVLGVQSPEALFSNKDCNGPTYSEFPDLFNYEMKAPGTNIISTIPNGNYRIYQGTSMAAPLVSGALSLYRKLISYDDETIELMWVKLIQATEQYLDIKKALTLIPKPEIRLIEYHMIDSIEGDNDGKVDAGERISFWFKIRNTGGNIDSTWLKLRLYEFEDKTNVEFIKPQAYIGSMSSYATLTSEKDPIIIKISPNTAHDRHIVFDLLMWHKESEDTTIQTFFLKVENGTHLDGILTSDFTLTPDKYWIMNKSLRISTGVTLKILPGTKLEVNTSVDNRGFIYARGNKDSLIHIKGQAINGNNLYKHTSFYFPNQSFNLTSNNNLDSCKFESNYYSIPYGNNNQRITAPVIRSCTFNDIGTYDWNSIITASQIVDSNLKNMMAGKGGFVIGEINNCVFENLYLGVIAHAMKHAINSKQLIDSRLSNCVIDNLIPNHSAFIDDWSLLSISYNSQNVTFNNSFLAHDSRFRYFAASGADDYITFGNNYLGSTDSLKIKSKFYDFNDDPTRPYMFTTGRLTAPSENCHGHVWKVLVNGKDAQDEIIDPLGVGKQRFDVYFNGPMDKTIKPQVSFGVRYPFTTHAVNEDESWSEDGKIYTVYKTIKLTTGDGINRIRVAEAKEANGWEHAIPVEDSRFEFIIAAASSASLEFMATPGLGKVALEWNNNDLEDGLGYNMYRMEHINDSTLTKPVLINNSLITDTLYTDFSVIPNKRYYYYYKVLRTNFVETDSSRVVSAIPFTASKGDANGDLSVNVLDITTIVAHLLNNNPQPFIREAADVNNDGQINVLDIVGVVNLVLNIPQQSAGIAMTKQVNLYMQNDTLFADSNVDIGALQLDLTGMEKFEDLVVLDALKGFESGNSYANGVLRVIFYSMSGKSILAGQGIPLLKLKSGTSIADAIAGEPNGSSVKVNYLRTRIPDIRNNMNQQIAELGQNYPNPTNGITTIPVRIYDQVDEITLRIVNMMGQEVQVIRIAHPYIGEHKLPWNSGTNKGLFVYTLELRNDNRKQMCPNRKMVVQ